MFYKLTYDKHSRFVLWNEAAELQRYHALTA